MIFFSKKGKVLSLRLSAQSVLKSMDSLIFFSKITYNDFDQELFCDWLVGNDVLDVEF